MGFDLALLFELLESLLNNCGDSAAAREKILTNPRRVWFGIGQGLRRDGKRGAEMREARKEIWQEYKNASPEQLSAFAHGGMDAVMAMEDNA